MSATVKGSIARHIAAHQVFESPEFPQPGFVASDISVENHIGTFFLPRKPGPCSTEQIAWHGGVQIAVVCGLKHL